jgi:hypothetical protein
VARPRFVRRPYAAALVAFVALVALTACSETGQPWRWSADITSQETRLHQAGAGNRNVYGWNLLTGAATIDGQRAQVELLGSVAYQAGQGPFWGFLTVTYPDGSSIGMRMEGRATVDGQTGQTRFRATLEVLGGTGRFVNVKGRGSWEGSRDTRLGGPVHMEVDVKLQNTR